MISGSKRRSAFIIAFVCVTGSLAGVSLPAWADGLDTSRLPRVAGGKTIFASEAVTTYTTSDTVAHAAAAARQMLSAQGWLAYTSPYGAQPSLPNLKIMTFKKGPQALNVMVTQAPAQGNATNVSYTALLVQQDLPLPKDATQLTFDPERPMMTCVTTMTTEQVLRFYRGELARDGWALWSPKIGGPGALRSGFSLYVVC